MKIGVFGRTFGGEFDTIIAQLMHHLAVQQVELWIYRPFLDFLNEKKIAVVVSGSFSSYDDMPHDLSLMMSIGGDGTFLHGVRMVRDTGIPMVGFNAGRLGFLANISMAEVGTSIDQLLQGNFSCEERTLLQMECEPILFGNYRCALNEMTIQKQDTSLITIHTWCDDVYLTTYWSDGLIISTPTGSSAYSLSVGGPIVSPNCHNFILSPIAAHNLNERPLVLPDTAVLRLRPESRSGSVMITLDSRTEICPSDVEFTLRKASYAIRVVKGNSFFATLRAKLMWGADKRN